MKIGRNDPCHCGSGKKYKKCCSANDEAARSAELAAAPAAAGAEDQPAPQQGHGVKAASPKTGGVAPRAKGPLPKRPTQLRRRAV
jgi:hypothetical protein